MGGRVVALAPGPDDLLMVTTIGYQPTLAQPFNEHDRALRAAQSFAKALAHVPQGRGEGLRRGGRVPHVAAGCKAESRSQPEALTDSTDLLFDLCVL